MHTEVFMLISDRFLMLLSCVFVYDLLRSYWSEAINHVPQHKYDVLRCEK